MSRPYSKTTWAGFTVDNRTASALSWVDARFRKRTGSHLQLAQGSYNAGGVSASAGTHDGGGVVDVRTSILTDDEKRILLRLLKRAGFAAWQRATVPGLWGQHIHACLLGTRRSGFHRTMSQGARNQVVAYLNGRDGLAGNRPDPSWRPTPQTRWSHAKGKPVRL